jgi:AraC-like DNA-binding protein
MGHNHSVLNKIHSIMTLIKNADIQLEIKVSSIIVQILTDIILAAAKGTAKLNKEEQNISVKTALDFIENNFHLDISLTDIAASANCSIFHFSRIFKKITGCNPYEYLIKYRINTAKALLETTKMSVDNIASDIGFKSTSNFILTFKKFENITPLKYRIYWNS